jgi:hypothetical protein
MLGGRTNHWGIRASDPKISSANRWPWWWPIGYEDIKPFYDKTDRLLGVLELMKIGK